MQNVSSINEDLVYIYPDANFAKGMNPKILKQVDLKLDDGEHWNGRMRTACYGKGTDATTPVILLRVILIMIMQLKRGRNVVI